MPEPRAGGDSRRGVAAAVADDGPVVVADAAAEVPVLSSLPAVESTGASPSPEQIAADACRSQVRDGVTEIVIAGLVPMSSVDWPGRIVATVFTQGCPWRCGYCQNPDLADPRVSGSVRWSDVLDLLRRRHGLLDGVVFSGGEPTLQVALPQAVDQVRSMGFGVGLHTGGAWPGRLEWLLPKIDWIGLDIKELPDRYEDVTGAGPSGAAAWRSLRIVLDSGIDYEVRTTVDPVIHTREEILAIGDRLAELGVRRWVIQEAREQGTSPEYARALAGRRLASVLRDDDLPGIERRLA